MRSANKSQKKYCKFERENKCQGEGSGGHIGTIRSLEGGYCAKITRSEKGKEVLFYQKHQESGYRELNEFIPKFGGFCVGPESHNKYVAMENIKDGFEKPWEIDIKIGLRSASRSELKNRMGAVRGAMKKKVHVLMDEYFSTSGKFGFRVENFSRDPENKKLQSKKMEPQEIFKLYFKHDKSGKVLKNFIKRIERFYRLIMQDDFDPYFLIASSLLFVYDKKNNINNNYDVNVKMIDFDHSEIVNLADYSENAKHHLRVNEYRYGILTLLKQLKYFYVNQDPGKSLFVRSSKLKTRYQSHKDDTDLTMEPITGNKKKKRHYVMALIKQQKKRLKTKKRKVGEKSHKSKRTLKSKGD